MISPNRLNMRRALLCGFGAVFVLWLLSAYELVRRLGELEGRGAAVSTRFDESEELLFTVRTQVLLGSVYVRDAALEIDPDAVRFDREQFQATRREIDRALEQYLPEVDSEVEREHWTRLQAELQDYWNTMVPVLTGQVSGDPADAQALIRQQVVPKRETIIRISDGIRTLNRDAFQQQQAEIAQLHEGLRQRVWWTSAVLVALGLIIAMSSTRYVGQLELRVRRQHLQELQHKLDLQRLSARLVSAQEEERRSLARDLHDEVGQALTAIKMELAAVERTLKAPGPESHHRLGEARSIADRTLQTVRDLSQLLHPGMLDDFGLSETLRWYVRGFSRRTGLRVQFVADGIEGRMAPELEVCAYRIVQEALTNVAKHADATSCRVYVQRLAHALLITVEDDGKGIDRAERIGSGLGLMSIRERVAGFGGTFRLENADERGARLTVEFPVSTGGRNMDVQGRDVATATHSVGERESLDGQTAHSTR
jgi:signal transduction histidine kinase